MLRTEVGQLLAIPGYCHWLGSRLTLLDCPTLHQVAQGVSQLYAGSPCCQLIGLPRMPQDPCQMASPVGRDSPFHWSQEIPRAGGFCDSKQVG